MPQLAQVGNKILQVSTQPTVVRLPNWSSVQAGQTSVLPLPLSQSYQRIWIQMLLANGNPLTEANIASAVTQLRVVVDGDAIWRLSGAQLQMLQKHWQGDVAQFAVPAPAGHAPITPGFGFLCLDFARAWSQGNINQEEAAALGTMDRKSVTIEIDQAGGGLISTMTSWAEVDVNYNLGRYIALRPYNIPVAANGDLQIFNVFPQDGNKSLCALHCQTNAITKFSVLPDGQSYMLNQIPYTLWARMMEKFGFLDQSGAGTPYQNLQFIRRFRNTDAFNLGNRAFQMILTFAGLGGAINLSTIAEISEQKVAA